MSDTSNTPSSNETDTSEDEVGRPDWSARDREEDPLADWMQGDEFVNDTPGDSTAAEATSTSNDTPPQEETSKPSSGDFDMSRFEEDENEDLTSENLTEGSTGTDNQVETKPAEGGAETEDQDTDPESDSLSGSAESGEDVSDNILSNEVSEDSSNTVSPDDFTMDVSFADDNSADDESTDTSEPDGKAVFLPEGNLPENWDLNLKGTVERWTNHSTRHKGVEAFKTGLVLPLLASLGYDVFNPDSIEPVEDESGRLDGYLAKSERGAFLVILDEADVPDDHREKVTMRTRRDRIAVGIRIPTEEGESRWQSVLDVEVSPDAALAGLRCVHHDIFDSAYIEHMARQVHGQQDDIIEAVRLVLTEPGRGFVEDVRERLVSSGHQDPIMLAERVSLAVARMLAGPDTAEEVEEDSKGRRELTPFENRAVELIREICAPQIDPSRIVPRPGQAYVAILLDDNNRRTIARLHFSAASKKYLGILTGNEENKEQIESTPDISRFSEALRARAAELDPEAF